MAPNEEMLEIFTFLELALVNLKVKNSVVWEIKQQFLSVFNLKVQCI